MNKVSLGQSAISEIQSRSQHHLAIQLGKAIYETPQNNRSETYS